ncbi:YheC/YheD family protein [Neobacillus sp. OS1-2]|uniref:YheC/YheD family protein n=1 Tax=Neobacillus sp. OS1-2 TaxID=3070680 RepID=UPI0027E0D724|nr:YheC/YheD family protein [Neobacillus sp. OS1-2]WML39226.1 YheC/YheD family protein [Neobacillus sp. OS1-2]
MNENLGKWKQSLLLQQNPVTAKYTPETTIYSLENLVDFICRYEFVYVKHNSTGQGRAIYKVYKRKDGQYCFTGFTMQGEPIHKCVTAIEDFHQLLHPFTKFGRLSGTYIIQEGVKSWLQNGQPFSIRVHVQNLEGEWVIGGMYGKIGIAETKDHGIANTHRGAYVRSMEELLMLHSKMDDSTKMDVINCLKEVSIKAAEVIATYFPNREYGIDFGLNREGNPRLFEVNTAPGIGGFARIEDKTIWKRIVAIRKLQEKADS